MIASTHTDSLFLGGEWLPASTDRTLTVVSPHTEEVLATVPEAAEADISLAVAAARRAFDEGPWPHTTPNERAEVLRALAAGIQGRAQDLAATLTAEMGTPANFALGGQVYTPAAMITGYADLLGTFEFERESRGVVGPCRVVKQPVGVCALIIPWNVPLTIIAMKLGAALASGSTAVVKLPPQTPLVGYVLAEVIEALGLPDGVVSVVAADREMSEHLVRHPGVDKVSFTGSTAAGRRIGGICGEALKRCTLELGGKSAAVILEDVDLAVAVPQLLPAAFLNNGQVCAAQSRVLAPRSRYTEVVEALAAAVGAATVGDPSDPTTFIGPLVSETQRDRVEGYVKAGVDEGARLVSGGSRPASLPTGWYVEPTLFADVDNGMTIAREEIFGPVLSVIPYDSEDDAVRIANDSDYGLSGSVWTADDAHGLEVGKRLRTGTVAINSGVVLDLYNPFGGFKQSGIGRELGPEGLDAYLETQTLVQK